MVNISRAGCFGTHWNPQQGRNTISPQCECCGLPLGVIDTARVFNWWRPYTRVVISTAEARADGTVLTTDVTNWCPACWGAVGRSAMEVQYPDVTFTEMETTPMTGSHSSYHFRELRVGDSLDSYAGPGATPGRHRGEITATATTTGPAVTPDRTKLTVDCTTCERVHSITDSPWRLVAAVRQP